MIKLVDQRVTKLYREVRRLLLKKKSYDSKVDTHNVLLYLSFLEAVLQRPYNRLASLTVFLKDDDGMLVNRMYPFAMLYDDTKEEIYTKFQQAGKLAAGLDVSGVDPNHQSLIEEPRIE